MAAATDVPGKYDLLIDVGGTKTGYLFNEAIETYARKNLAIYGYSPTFVERQNVSGNYGDDSQAFWMTASQNDWSLGEQQKFFRSTDDSSRSKFWQGTNVDVTKEGSVSMRKATRSLTYAAAVHAVVTRGGTSSEEIAAVGTTNLYTVTADGTITDRGAHGLGVAPSEFGTANDGADVFISSTSGGTVGVRRMDTAYAFTTFSATGSDQLAFHNNSLYGYRGAAGTGDLQRYDTAGAVTSLFTWKAAAGAALATGSTRLKSVGPKLFILRSGFMPQGPDLWVYDGVGTNRVVQFPPSTYAYSLEVLEGIVFIGTSYVRNATPNVSMRPTIFYYANGSMGQLWQAPDYATFSTPISNHGSPVMTTFENGLAFTDDTTGRIMFYNPGTGGFHAIGSYTVANDTPQLASALSFIVHTRNATAAYQYPTPTTTATTATITSSLFDFDSSLNKMFRGIKVDFDSATDGDGGSVDIAYRVGDVDGSYTTLQTGAVSGTEYTLTGITGRNLSIKITLNKGTSTLGPVLKRTYVRAVPILQQYKLRSYDISCVGNIDQRQILRDGTMNPNTGRELANALVTAITSTTPITIYDRFTAGGYTAILEPAQCSLNEIHAVSEAGSKSGEFNATIVAREV